MFLSVSLPLLFHTSTRTLSCTPSSMWTAPRETPAAHSHNEECCLLAIYTPPTDITDLCEARHNLGEYKSPQFVCRRLFASGQSMHQFQDSLLFHQPSRFVLMETQWSAESDHQMRRFGHSSLCFWITVERKPLAMWSEDGLIAFVSTAFISSFFGATESTVFVVSAKDTNIFSYEAIPLGNLQSLQHIS